MPFDRAVRLAAIVGSFVLLTTGGGAVASPETPTPTEVVSGVAERTVAILTDETLDRDTRLVRLRELGHEFFDLPTISKLVLARNWRDFTNSQRADFQTEFESYLIRRYGKGIDEYQGERVRIVDERAEPRGDVSVRTQLVGGSTDGLRVDYRLRPNGSTWLVIDVIIEGVSFVANYRAQFKEVLLNSEPDRLIEILRTKNAESSRSGAKPN
jgi:phospholipid transport system substrate-binding protein